MRGSNNLDKVKAIIARWLGGDESRGRDWCVDEPSLKDLQLAEKLMFMTAAAEVNAVVKESKALVGLAPRWTRGQWMTKGRFRKGMTQVFGSSELPNLLSSSRLAYLIMVKAHEEDHRALKSTLWRSRA